MIFPNILIQFNYQRNYFPGVYLFDFVERCPCGSFNKGLVVRVEQKQWRANSDVENSGNCLKPKKIHYWKREREKMFSRQNISRLNGNILVFFYEYLMERFIFKGQSVGN
jgi:hypothetical protein